ncbi:MAG: lppS 2 [Frankiales bacterium]|nr:lppS 2 [Frankiales bacterium]
MPRIPRNDSGLAKLAVLLGLAGAVAVGATGAVLLNGSSNPLASVGVGPQPTPAPTVVVAVAGARGATVPWSAPLTFSVTDGTITSVTTTAADGTPLAGTLTPTRWTSNTTLVPRQTYTVHAEVKNGDGKSSTIDKQVQASAATQVLHATISPAGGVYGIGQPVIVRFDRMVKGAATRAAVLSRLQVTTTPAVAGAWHWYNSYEVHYRGPQYWKPGSTVKTTASLGGLRLPGSATWGDTTPTTSQYSIGDALVGTVDVTAHKMTVTRNGKVVRVMNVSTGRDKYPTKGGVHIVLVRQAKFLYNSATVGIPTASPDGYYEYLPWSVRISNGGAFVHANPATVGVQGVLNVSHGCVNASIADAKWFYDNSKLGDIVNVIHSVAPPNLGDEGMADWNYSWAEWKLGGLNGY